LQKRSRGEVSDRTEFKLEVNRSGHPLVWIRIISVVETHRDTKIMGKSWENHGKIMGKSWENHGNLMKFMGTGYLLRNRRSIILFAFIRFASPSRLHFG